MADASSIHTVRWANALAGLGYEIHVISQHPVIDQFDYRVRLHLFRYMGILGYFLIVFHVKRLLREINPDLINAHYASGYGTTARLVAFKPCILSVWGSDVYKFPYKSPLHKWLIRKNLNAACAIASTSLCMADQVRNLLGSVDEITITPFGVDLSVSDTSRISLSEDDNEIVIGTVKSMELVYGIDTLIKAFANLIERLKLRGYGNALKLSLRVVGGGSKLEDYKLLAQKLGVSHLVKFVGQVPHVNVHYELTQMDIYVALSREESFGVSVLEACAAFKPVVVSDASGLKEITVDNVTGIIVPKDNPALASLAIEKLVFDKNLRYRMGYAGHLHVVRLYSWEHSINKMLSLYKKTIQNSKNR